MANLRIFPLSCALLLVACSGESDDTGGFTASATTSPTSTAGLTTGMATEVTAATTADTSGSESDATTSTSTSTTTDATSTTTDATSTTDPSTSSTTDDTTTGVDTSTTAPPPACGDGVVDDGEACDDGNLDDGDGCSASCTIEECGNGIVEGDEACDDGNADDTDECLSTCVAASCGDGFIQAGAEECDGMDPPNATCDACQLSCKPLHDDCNMMAGDGCELDTSADVNNCGACNKACAMKETCEAGVCKPPITTFGPEHSFVGMISNHYITQGCCSVNCVDNDAVQAAYFCEHFYGVGCTPKVGYFKAQTPNPTYPKMHKFGGCTSNGSNIPNTTCEGGPCKIGNWNETTTGLTNLVCECQ